MMEKLFFLKLAIFVVTTSAKDINRIQNAKLSWVVGLPCRPNEYVAKGAGCGSSRYYVCTNRISGIWKLEEQSCHHGCCFHAKKKKCYCEGTHDRGFEVGLSKMLPVPNLLSLDASKLYSDRHYWKLNAPQDFSDKELNDQFGWIKSGKIHGKTTMQTPSSNLKEIERTEEPSGAIEFTNTGPEEKSTEFDMSTPASIKVYKTRKHQTTNKVGSISNLGKYSAKNSVTTTEEPKSESTKETLEDSTTKETFEDSTTKETLEDSTTISTKTKDKHERRKHKLVTSKPEESNDESQPSTDRESPISSAYTTESSKAQAETTNNLVDLMESTTKEPKTHKSKTATKKSKTKFH